MSFSGKSSTVGNHKHWMDTIPKDDLNFSGVGSRTQEYGLVADQGNYDTNANQMLPENGLQIKVHIDIRLVGQLPIAVREIHFTSNPPSILSFILCTRDLKFFKILSYIIMAFSNKQQINSMEKSVFGPHNPTSPYFTAVATINYTTGNDNEFVPNYITIFYCRGDYKLYNR